MCAPSLCDRGSLAGFTVSERQWEAAHLAAKLQMPYDRIHEVRMRFEVLEAQRQIEHWQSLETGPSPVENHSELDRALNADLN